MKSIIKRWIALGLCCLMSLVPAAQTLAAENDSGSVSSLQAESADSNLPELGTETTVPITEQITFDYDGAWKLFDQLNEYRVSQ